MMFEGVLERFNAAQSFLITGHVNPEGDCFGSIMAVSRMLQQMGKTTTVVCHDPVPRDLVFLKFNWITVADLAPDFHCDCVVALDTPHLKRLGSVGDYVREHKNIVVIDHHISNTEFGQVNVVDAHASSCGEMIYTLLKEAGSVIAQDTAMALYIAISTDTGSFRYSNTTQRTHEVVADLVSTGIDIAMINERLYSSMTKSRFELFKRFLERVQFGRDDRIACSYVTSDDLTACAGTSDDLEGFVNYLRDINGVDIAVFAFQKGPSGPTKVSFRAKGTADVNLLAQQFDGGGHTKAAGGTVQAPVAEALSKIMQKAEASLIRE